jgi:hypothetical protein
MVPLLRLFLPSLLAVLAAGCLSRGAREEARLFTLKDPSGDDHGDGSLRYPLREDLRPGSMDLLSLEAHAEGGGTRFEAIFARPIVKPQAGHAVDAIGTSLRDVARHGFYTFNLDVYVDTDGAEGSGRTDTLPGRNLQLAPASAWEKAVLLTPRPHEARDMLRKLWREQARAAWQKEKGALSEPEGRTLDAQVDRTLEERVFFPTRIHVTGPTVSFFVPDSFLGGPAKGSWGYAVAVTGAQLDIKVSLPAFLGGVAPPQRGLMVLDIQPGDSRERFGGGRSGDPGQSPVVDLVVPEGVTQAQVLAASAPPWPAVVPAPASPPALPQPPDAGAPGGQGGAPGSRAP